MLHCDVIKSWLFWYKVSVSDTAELSFACHALVNRLATGETSDISGGGGGVCSAVSVQNCPPVWNVMHVLRTNTRDARNQVDMSPQLRLLYRSTFPWRAPCRGWIMVMYTAIKLVKSRCLRALLTSCRNKINKIKLTCHTCVLEVEVGAEEEWSVTIKVN